MWAYTDADADNQPDSFAGSPDCGPSISCLFALSLTQTPDFSWRAAVANLFYLNNVIHDIQYRYGFDEAGGNFQWGNYNRGGSPRDYVLAEAQDGSGTDNANFQTPPDGQNPRMQMYVYTRSTPRRDAAFDSGVIVHEYGHGISNRLVGGPSNVTCLANPQQAGEGLSDWWSMVYTARPGQVGPTPRGMGTYVINEPTTGPGIRTQRYSTDQGVNNWTYASMAGMSVPHGVGSVWAQGMSEAYWALVNQYGYSPNLYDAMGGSGNQRAMLYVNESLKNTACNPTFLDVRDGIVQAAADNYGGADVCRLWTAFAAFGMGSNANSGGASSTTPTNGFAVPPTCGPPTAQPPGALTVAAMAGNTVTLKWTLPVGGLAPTQYVLEGGVAAGQVLVSTPTGSTAARYTFVAPTGSFFVRMHTLSGGSRSAASNEVVIHVGVPVAPSAPANLLSLVNGSTLALAWKNTFGGGAPSSLILDVTGSLTTSLPIGVGESFSFAGVPGGTYSLRVRAANGAGASAPSNAVSLSFPGACSGVPQAPADLLAYKAGNTIFVSWDLGAGGAAPTGYALNVSGGFNGSIPTGSRSISGAVGAGTYNLSVVASNACGASSTTAVQTLTIP